MERWNEFDLGVGMDIFHGTDATFNAFSTDLRSPSYLTTWIGEAVLHAGDDGRVFRFRPMSTLRIALFCSPEELAAFRDSLGLPRRCGVADTVLTAARKGFAGIAFEGGDGDYLNLLLAQTDVLECQEVIGIAAARDIIAAHEAIGAVVHEGLARPAGGMVLSLGRGFI